MIIIISILIGLSVGSFINAYIYRLDKKDQSVWRGRSQCPKCQHILAWKDLIPILSYILLGGKCRQCQKKISSEYPAVELLTAGLFAAVYLWQNPSYNIDGIISLIFWWFTAAALIIIAVYDLKTQLIPSRLIYITAVVTVIFNFQFSIINYVYGSLFGIGAIGLIVLVTRGRGMGAGDIELTGLLGLLVGYPLIIVNLSLSFIIGAIISLFLLAAKFKKLKDPIPFGPFLIAGTFISLFYGEQIVKWYMGLII